MLSSYQQGGAILVRFQRSVWENDPAARIAGDYGKCLHDEFMVSVASSKSEYVYFINYGSVYIKYNDKVWD